MCPEDLQSLVPAPTPDSVPLWGWPSLGGLLAPPSMRPG